MLVLAMPAQYEKRGLQAVVELTSHNDQCLGQEISVCFSIFFTMLL